MKGKKMKTKAKCKHEHSGQVWRAGRKVTGRVDSNCPMIGSLGWRKRKRSHNWTWETSKRDHLWQDQHWPLCGVFSGSLTVVPVLACGLWTEAVWSWWGWNQLALGWRAWEAPLSSSRSASLKSELRGRMCNRTRGNAFWNWMQSLSSRRLQSPWSHSVSVILHQLCRIWSNQPGQELMAITMDHETQKQYVWKQKCFWLLIWEPDLFYV